MIVMKILQVKINGEIKVRAEVPEEGMLDAFFALWSGLMKEYPTHIDATYYLEGRSSIKKSWELPKIIEGDEVSFKIVESGESDKPTTEEYISSEEDKLTEKYANKLEKYRLKLIAELEEEKKQLQS